MQSQPNWYEAIITWFARNPVAANLLMTVLLLGGLFTALTIKKELQPRIEINVVQVSVPYLGAAPLEVEQGVCLKVEEAIQDLQGIQELTCQAREGLGVISAEIDVDYDIAEVQDEIKIRVDSISTFPAETEKPVVSRARFEQPIMWLSVYGDVSEKTLYEFAKSIRDEMLALPDITRVEIIGSRPYEISIEVSEVDLERYNLTFDELAQAIRRGSLDLPGGSIRTNSGDVLLRTTGQAYVKRDFEQLVIRTNRDGSRVLLSDVAEVQDAFADVESYSTHNGKDAIAVRVLSVGQQSELALAETVRKFVEERSQTLPSGIGLDYWADVTFYLNGRLNMMVKNLLGGAVLVFLVLALFLRFKLAFWVMVGLPVAFMGAFFLMPSAGVTLNMTSLFGFILVLGIVVDDAIVIGESAYTQIRRHGHSERHVVDGVLRVAVPAHLWRSHHHGGVFADPDHRRHFWPVLFLHRLGGGAVPGLFAGGIQADPAGPPGAHENGPAGGSSQSFPVYLQAYPARPAPLCRQPEAVCGPPLCAGPEAGPDPPLQHAGAISGAADPERRADRERRGAAGSAAGGARRLYPGGPGDDRRYTGANHSRRAGSHSAGAGGGGPGAERGQRPAARQRGGYALCLQRVQRDRHDDRGA